MRKYIDNKLAAELRKAGISVYSVNYINVESTGKKKSNGYTVQRRTVKRDAEIRQYAKDHPNAKHPQIALEFGHGASTVSKILSEEA